MLSPDALEEAGQLTGRVYRQVELEMLHYIERKLIDGDIYTSRAQSAIAFLAQSSSNDLQAIITKHQDEIDAAVQDDVESAIRASSADDVSRIRKATGAAASGVTTRQVAATINGVARTLSRHNLAMSEAARSSLVNAATEAVIKTNAGVVTREQAKREAVRRIARQGIQIVTYTSGVRMNAADAIERYIRSEISQECLSITELLILRNGVEFVEVSSHTGARPSHAEWQGQCYSMNGRVRVDGVVYEDFYESTGYGGLKGPYADIADRLGGVNCGHAFGPWMPGMARTYEPDPVHPSGLSNAEIYDLRQGQRKRERDIRVTKRELAGAQNSLERNPGSLACKADVAGLKAKLAYQQEGMRAYIEQANARCRKGTSVLQRSTKREWAGDIKVTSAVSRGSMTSFRAIMASPAVERERIKAGISKAALNRAMHDEIDRQGLTLRQFCSLPSKERNSLTKKAALVFVTPMTQ